MTVAAAALQQPPRSAGSPSAIWGTPCIWCLTKIWTNFIDSIYSPGVQSAVCIPLGIFEPLRCAIHSVLFLLAIHSELALQKY